MVSKKCNQDASLLLKAASMAARASKQFVLAAVLKETLKSPAISSKIIKYPQLHNQPSFLPLQVIIQTDSDSSNFQEDNENNLDYLLKPPYCVRF